MGAARLIWTRALEDWDSDRPLVEGLGLPFLRLPCIEVARLEAVDFPACKHYVFTSPRAVRLCLGEPRWAERLRSASSCFAFGAKTIEALKRGHGPVEEIKADYGSELAKALVSRVPKGEPIGIVAPKEPAFDIAGFLGNHGHEVSFIPVYETRAGLWDERGRPLSTSQVLALGNDLQGLVCFASPSAVKGFTTGFQPVIDKLGTSLVALCVGETTADKARTVFRDVRISSAATMEAMTAEALRLKPLFISL